MREAPHRRTGGPRSGEERVDRVPGEKGGGGTEDNLPATRRPRSRMRRRRGGRRGGMSATPPEESPLPRCCFVCPRAARGDGNLGEENMRENKCMPTGWRESTAPSATNRPGPTDGILGHPVTPAGRAAVSWRDRGRASGRCRGPSRGARDDSLIHVCRLQTVSSEVALTPTRCEISSSIDRGHRVHTQSWYHGIGGGARVLDARRQSLLESGCYILLS